MPPFEALMNGVLVNSIHCSGGQKQQIGRLSARRDRITENLSPSLGDLSFMRKTIDAFKLSSSVIDRMDCHHTDNKEEEG